MDATPAPDKVKVVKESVSLRDLQLQVLNDAYLSSCDGYSVDRLLADPQLQTRFETACREAGLFGEPAHWNHELLRLRKAGKLAKPAVPQTVTLGSKEFDTYKFAGEIAWRHVSDKYPDVSIDEIFCRPELAQLFDRTAAKFCPGRAAVDFRWAALYLRKSRHTLAAEAKEYDYVFRTRNFGEALKLGPRLAQRWEGQGGVYLLLGARRAPLFVGDTLDLGQRLALHVAAAGSKAKVTQVAVITDAELPSSDYREALKHDLAQRWKSAWNVT